MICNNLVSESVILVGWRGAPEFPSTFGLGNQLKGPCDLKYSEALSWMNRAVFELWIPTEGRHKKMFFMTFVRKMSHNCTQGSQNWPWSIKFYSESGYVSPEKGKCQKKRFRRTEKYMFSSSATVYFLHIQLYEDLQFHLLWSNWLKVQYEWWPGLLSIQGTRSMDQSWTEKAWAFSAYQKHVFLNVYQCRAFEFHLSYHNQFHCRSRNTCPCGSFARKQRWTHLGTRCHYQGTCHIWEAHRCNGVREKLS